LIVRGQGYFSSQTKRSKPSAFLRALRVACVSLNPKTEIEPRITGLTRIMESLWKHFQTCLMHSKIREIREIRGKNSYESPLHFGVQAEFDFDASALAHRRHSVDTGGLRRRARVP
jgi:hypothetical protein